MRVPQSSYVTDDKNKESEWEANLCIESSCLNVKCPAEAQNEHYLHQQISAIL